MVKITPFLIGAVALFILSKKTSTISAPTYNAYTSSINQSDYSKATDLQKMQLALQTDMFGLGMSDAFKALVKGYV